MKRLAWVCILAVAGCQGSGSDHGTKDSGPKAEPTAMNTEAFDKAMGLALPFYIAAQEALAADKTTSIQLAGTSLAAALKSVDATGVTGPDAEKYAAIPTTGRKAAMDMAASKDIKTAREHFKTLSKSIAPWAKNARPAGYDLVWCSMAPGGWVQKAGPIRNPYYGASMLECGEKTVN